MAAVAPPAAGTVSEQDIESVRAGLHAFAGAAADFASLRDRVLALIDDPEWRFHVLSVDLLEGLFALERAMERDPADERWEIRQARDALVDVLDTMEREIAHNELDSPPVAAHRLAVWLREAGDEAISTLAGVDRRTVRSWRTRPPREIRGSGAAERVVLVAQVVSELRRSMTPGAIVRWFERPRPQLGGRSPAEVLAGPRRGRDALRDLARGSRGQLAT